MRDIFSERARKLYVRDRIILGTGLSQKIQRHRLNPLRYLMGEIKVIRINPKKLYERPKSIYPVCPECGYNTIVAFTPPREGIVGTEEGYRTIGTPEYVDWSKAHLYCCNGETNCKFETRFTELTTPLKEKKRNILRSFPWYKRLLTGF